MMKKKGLSKRRIFFILCILFYVFSYQEEYTTEYHSKQWISLNKGVNKFVNVTNLFDLILYDIRKFQIKVSRNLDRIFWKHLNFPRLYVSSKVIYGLYNDKHYSMFSNFCYTPSTNDGVLILHNEFIPDSKLLLLDKTNDEIYSYAYNKNGKECQALEVEALMKQPVNELQNEAFNASYIIYEKNIDKTLFEKNLSFILLHCNNNIKNAFKVEFRNNINFLKNHFSCEEQGLIEIYMLLMVILIVLLLTYRRQKEKLLHINSALRESINCATIFFFLSNLFYFIHIWVYAFNGMGYSILKVLSQIYESIFDCFMLSIICYILNNNSNKQKKYEETFHISIVYSILKFTYTLFEIQHVQNLNLYISLFSFIAFPFIVSRVAIAVIIHNNATKLLKEKKNLSEKFFIILGYLAYNSWILSVPFLYIFLRSSSVHLTHLYTHFSNLLILIYLVYNVSQKKYEIMESKNPYLDLK